jgi:hypothetical protein
MDAGVGGGGGGCCHLPLVTRPAVSPRLNAEKMTTGYLQRAVTRHAARARAAAQTHQHSASCLWLLMLTVTPGNSPSVTTKTKNTANSGPCTARSAVGEERAGGRLEKGGEGLGGATLSFSMISLLLCFFAALMETGDSASPP